jgi:hypothetical protein
MATYIVTHDLHTPGKDYKDLIAYLNSFATHFHAQGSVWFIVSDLSATNLRDGCTKYMDANDKIIVNKAAAPGAWRGYSSDVDEWLKKYLL